MDLSIAKRPMNKDWEMNAFLPENKRHFLPQDKLATKNHSSHFAPNLTLLSFQIRTCADVIQRCHKRLISIDDTMPGAKRRRFTIWSRQEIVICHCSIPEPNHCLGVDLVHWDTILGKDIGQWRGNQWESFKMHSLFQVFFELFLSLFSLFFRY